jgi:hypothetical protein
VVVEKDGESDGPIEGEMKMCYKESRRREISYIE